MIRSTEMDAQKFAIPLLAFAGGAILGRLLGLKNLVRGAMTAAAVTGMATQPARITSNTHARGAAGPRRRKAVSRGAQRKSAQKKSASA
jgi:hypothetical protein